MATPTSIRHHRFALAAALVAGAALLAPAGVLGATENQKAPPRHVLCSKAKTWIPLTYNGGCFLWFSRSARLAVYADFAKAAETNSQWAGPSAYAAVQQMKCQRGSPPGDPLKLDKMQAGLCSWPETFRHVGYDEHPDHTWQCVVVMVVRTSMNGAKRTVRGRIEMQWDVTAAVKQSEQAGWMPNCDQTVPEDQWSSGTLV